jgi:hypothetical protein
MPTLPEQLRFELNLGQRVQLVLRSGHTLTGDLEEVDLIASIVRIDGWTARIGEIAAVRAEVEDQAA